ncbi:beta-ketoacyl-[acyl-carrier-protein] synthase family protein [Streptomyces aureocirculatus]|uniref:beta-ketoacyl-[acyl-carrier-protein] synthase family protein n=1 Tax=Streptomyces aureocirculatus TaxID=67275 RepID=UPI0004C78892|nr:beta-ketoacyl-[acyl-carrier-protein] synthase family protein [Streptomyces aureocirculatus]
MSTDDIAVTGIGLITPAGTDLDTNWATLCAGRSTAAPDPRLARLPVDFSCQVTGFSPTEELGTALARRLDPPAHFALAAARQAVTHAGLDSSAWPRDRVGVVLGVGSNSTITYGDQFRHLYTWEPQRVSPLTLPRSLPNMVAAEVAIDLGAGGPNFTTATACASGATALGAARDLLRGGSCDIVLAGGSESGRDPMAAVCFHRMRALSTRRDAPHLASRPFDAQREGFVLGEGAAVLVLERARDARARHAPVLALLRGYGATCDAHHPLAPHPDGDGTVRALRAALDDANCTPADVGHVNAHGTSTRFNDAIEAAAVTRVFASHTPAVTAPKSVVGHALGAAGAIEAAYTVLALREQTVPPTANFTHQDGDHKLDIVAGAPRPLAMTAALSSSCGFGGQNAALLFTTP